MKLPKMKTKLFLGCALQFLINSELFAKFELEDFDPEQHRVNYNALPSVVKSDEELQKSSQFQAFLKDADEIVTRYELNNLVGLRLIHQHFFLGDNQVMAERYEVVNNVPSLITQAISFEEAKKMDALPSSWIFPTSGKNELVLFETSSDPAVMQAKSILEKSPNFFNEMGKAIGEYNLNHLLSLAILKRDSLIAQEDQIYAEINSHEHNRSIVQLLNTKDITSNSVRTSWSFKGPKQVDCHGHSICTGHHTCFLHL